MIAEMSAAITAVKAVKDSAKYLADVSKSYDQVELRLKIVELVGQVTDLSDELNGLRQKLGVRESVNYVDGLYWKIGEENKGDPYCARCMEADDKLVHMMAGEETAGPMSEGYFFWGCISCKHQVRRNDLPTKPAYGFHVGASR